MCVRVQETGQRRICWLNTFENAMHNNLCKIFSSHKHCLVSCYLGCFRNKLSLKESIVTKLLQLSNPFLGYLSIYFFKKLYLLITIVNSFLIFFKNLLMKKAEMIYSGGFFFEGLEEWHPFSDKRIIFFKLRLEKRKDTYKLLLGSV